MNNILLAVLISAALTHAFPRSPADNPNALAPPDPNNNDAPRIIPPPFQEDDWWSSLAYALTKLKNGVKVRQVVSINFGKEEEKPLPLPPLPNLPPLPAVPQSLLGSRSLSMGPLASRSQATPTPKPLTGDVGICATEIMNPTERMHTGVLYSTSRLVHLVHPILPKRVKCRHAQPTSGKGKCVLVAYPHGAYIRVTPANLRLYNVDYCSKIATPGDEDYQCWEYIAVPGYCVLARPK